MSIGHILKICKPENAFLAFTGCMITHFPGLPLSSRGRTRLSLPICPFPVFTDTVSYRTCGRTYKEKCTHNTKSLQYHNLLTICPVSSIALPCLVPCNRKLHFYRYSPSNERNYFTMYLCYHHDRKSKIVYTDLHGFGLACFQCYKQINDLPTGANVSCGHIIRFIYDIRLANSCRGYVYNSPTMFYRFDVLDCATRPN